MKENIAFYLWWIGINGARDYLALGFLLGTGDEGRGIRRKQKGIWMCLSVLMTWAAVRFSVPGMFLCHVLFLTLFSRGILKMNWQELAAPAAALFTVSTFVEGISALTLSFLASHARMNGGEIALQVVISCLSVILYFFLLKRIRRKYLRFGCFSAGSNLSLLLLPCVTLVLAVRFCLRLDGRAFESYLGSLETSAGVTIGVVVGTAVFLFFLILEMFSRMVFYIEEKQAAVFFTEQMRGWQAYLKKIQRQSEGYASFQHDVDNHLLVLAGLMQEGKYQEAEAYGADMYGMSLSLERYASSGNTVVDILLDEKLREARKHGLEIHSDVQIPQGCRIKDMDLCVVFSNLLDNALRACRAEGMEAPALSVQTRMRGEFLIVETVNTALLSGPVREGTGLYNIRRIARRYHGTVELEIKDGKFWACVLLCPFRNPREEGEMGKLP